MRLLKINLTIAFRRLLQDRTTSLLNILGLAVGMGMSLALYQFVQFESHYDQFHPSWAHTYRITRTEYHNQEEGATQVTTPFALGAAVAAEIPGVQQCVRLHPQYFGAVVMNPEAGTPLMEDKMCFADSTFFDVFGFKLLAGNPHTALQDRHSIVLTAAMARKYFPYDVSCVGKTLRVSDGWADGDYVVSGILQDLPHNTHLDFDFLMPLQTLLSSPQYARGGGWGRNNFITYVTLANHTNLPGVEAQIDQLLMDNFGKTLAKYNVALNFHLQPLQDIHLKRRALRTMYPGWVVSMTLRYTSTLPSSSSSLPVLTSLTCLPPNHWSGPGRWVFVR